MKWFLLLLLSADVIGQTNVVSANPRFQVSWKQTNEVEVRGWNVAIMDRGTLNVRSSTQALRKELPLTTNMFPGSGVWDLRINAYSQTQTSAWSQPLTINWNPVVLSAPKNFRIQAVLP